jgi:flap endonuclease GEN
MTIEAYSMDKIEGELGYSREMLVLLGLLLGCDYDPKGIPGVGKELACKFLEEFSKSVENNEPTSRILDYARAWSAEDFSVDASLKYENRIRKAVLQNNCDGFPNEDIINEYMTISKLAQALMSNEKYLTIQWSRPLLCELQFFNEKKQAWPYDYTANKVVPLILRYEEETGVDMHRRDLRPVRVNAVRRRNAAELYEIVWSKMRSNIDRDLSQLAEYVTLESKEWFEKTYPQVASVFEESIEKKKSTRSKNSVYFF